MFAKPRPKKSVLPPPNKERKTTSAIEEIAFDNDARHDYLTGFHNRKQQRIKHAQEQAAKQARLEKLQARKQMRDERRREVEQHVEAVNRMLRLSSAAVDPVESDSDQEDVGDWDGFPDKPDLDMTDHKEEYIDEDRYTTVTVESVSVSRDGLGKPALSDDDEASENKEAAKPGEGNETGQKAEARRTRPKKKKFRYESKIERQLTDRRQRSNKSRKLK